MEKDVMGNVSQAVVVSYNIDNVEVCASAARISTTKGDAVAIFEKSKGNEKNRQLVQKVLQSGHKSVIEHAVFTIAMKDVSAFAEQFFIECRLASFTVKSRRYVDFGSSGYYIPADLAGEERDLYCRYMDALFAAYNMLLEHDIPKEDARFLLPYSFHSNFYFTLNARELANVIHNIRCGRGRGIPELQDLADQITEQVEQIFPCICLEENDISEEACPESDEGHEGCAAGSVDCGTNRSGSADADKDFSRDMLHVEDEITWIGCREAGAVELLNGPADPARILRLAYSMNHPGTHEATSEAALRSDASGAALHSSESEAAFRSDASGAALHTSVPETTLHSGESGAALGQEVKSSALAVKELLGSVRPRELEQLCYSFLISNVTLSGITHIVRHRMQSIIIPSIGEIAHSKVIVPETIEKNPDMLEAYKAVLQASNAMLKEMSRNDKLRRYSYYYALSGNVMDVMTTMNARELGHFMKLRTCNRAQWEIRKIAVEMLRDLRTSFPELFRHFGPSCFVLGRCPEGRMTCGKMDEVIAEFRGEK